MLSDRQVRMALWLALAFTANANRRHFGLTTTWAPHLIGNSVGLALPELVAAIQKLLSPLSQRSASLKAVLAAAADVTGDPPGWGPTMAPVTLAYVVSHPQFNIYRGDWAELRLMGLGLDAIPHSATAFSLTALVFNGLAALERQTPSGAVLRPLVRLLSGRPHLVSALVLAALTAAYELGEYRIHSIEMAETGGDEERMNMMWSPEDTAADIVANTLGWLAATALQGQQAAEQPAPA